MLDTLVTVNQGNDITTIRLTGGLLGFAMDLVLGNPQPLSKSLPIIILNDRVSGSTQLFRNC